MADGPNRYGEFNEFLAAVTANRARLGHADASWLAAVGTAAGTSAFRAVLAALGGLGLTEVLAALGILAGPIGMLLSAGFFAFSAYSLYQTLQELQAKADPEKLLEDQEQIERAKRIHAELKNICRGDPHRWRVEIDHLFNELSSGRRR